MDALISLVAAYHPESLRLLTSLKTINVVRNRLEFVPDALCTLTRIVDLELSVNRCACVRWCPLFSYALRVIVIVLAATVTAAATTATDAAADADADAATAPRATRPAAAD